MSDDGAINTDFDPNELVREILNPSFALPVTALQREVLELRKRLGPRLLQELSNLLSDGVDAVTAILAVKQQDRRQSELEVVQTRQEAEAKEVQIRQEARAAHGREGGAAMHKKGQKTGHAVIAEYSRALAEVRKPHGGKRFHGDHTKAIAMVVKNLVISKTTVYRHLKGLGPRSNDASE